MVNYYNKRNVKIVFIRLVEIKKFDIVLNW